MNPKREYVFAGLMAISVPAITWILLNQVWLPHGEVGILSYSFIIANSFLSHVEIYILTVGAWGGLSLTWLFDPYKKRLGFVPILFGSVVFLSVGSVELINELTVWSIILGVISFWSFIGIGGIPLYDYLSGNVDTLREDVPNEKGVYLTVAIVAAVVFSGSIDTHILSDTGVGLFNTDVLPQTLIAGSVLLFLFWKASEYTKEKSIVQVGPARSGKTYLSGGLYTDAKHSSAKTNYIEEVRDDLVEDKRISDTERTRINEGEVTGFTYATENPIFKKKITVALPDYPGEFVSGEGNDPRIGDVIERVRNGSDNSNRDEWRRIYDPIVDYAKSLPRKIRELTTLTRQEAVIGKGVKGREELAELIDAADLIAFIIPMGEEEFLREVRDRENEPKYLEGGGSHDRDSIDEYMQEYKSIIRRLDESDTSFVWIATMSDLVLNDFMEICNSDETEEVYSDYKERSDDKNPSLEPLEALIGGDSDLPSILYGPGQSDRHRKIGAYALFSKWIESQYIEKGYSNFGGGDGLLNKSSEEQIFPVWFSIKENKTENIDGGLVIDEAVVNETGRPEPTKDYELKPDRVLNGSDYLLERIEDRYRCPSEIKEEVYQCLYLLSQAKDTDDE
jgi:hypothetical protein